MAALWGVLARLDGARASPEYATYLAYIFSEGTTLAAEVRQAAGLLLKNSLRPGAMLPRGAAWDTLQHCLLGMLADDSRPLRHTAGTCLAAAVATAGLPAWPALVPALAAGLSPGAALPATEGALDTLYKLTEEQPLALEAELGGDVPAVGASPGEPHPARRPCANEVLLPRALALFEHPDAGVRAAAVAVLNLAAGAQPGWLASRMDDLLRGLFARAHDADPRVRREVCAGLVSALALAPDRLQGSLPDLIEYMLGSSADGDEAVALESCEFWSALCEYVDDTTVLRPFLPRLLPLLLRNMVFEEHDDEVAEAEAEEQRIEAGETRADRDADVRPFVGHGGGGGGGGETSADNDDDDDDEEEVGRWNLRRCSAAALDMLSTVFGDELLPVLLPAIQDRLAQPDWRAQEAAILALGAISQGCTAGLAPYLQALMAMLLPATQSPRPMVRCIASWAVARYSRWLFGCAEPGAEQPGVATVTTVVKALAERCMDRNPVVQKAACGSLATLVELGGSSLGAGEVAAIAAALAGTLQRYGRRTLRYAYDAIATLAEQAGAALGAPEAAAALLPPLYARLAAIPDADQELLPLLECLTAVVQAVGSAVEPWAQDSFSRCIRLTAGALEGLAAAGGSEEAEEEAAQVLVCALDYLAAVVEVLGSRVEPLARSSSLLDLVLCAGGQGQPPEVRQSAFAALGDLAKSCTHLVAVRLPEAAAACAAQLAPAAVTGPAIPACNNAAWALGELAARLPAAELATVALGAMERYATLLAAQPGTLPRNLRENAAIALGRVARGCPALLAPHARAFVAPMASVLAGVRDGAEKEQALAGLCALLRQEGALQAAAPAFPQLCFAMASWRTPPGAHLLAECSAVLEGLRALLRQEGQWDAAVASLSPAVAQKLRDTYGLV